MNRIITAESLAIALMLVTSGCSSYPDIRVEGIQRDIIGRNTGEGLISWTFSPEEPRKIVIVETMNEG